MQHSASTAKPLAPDGYVGARIGDVLLFARVAQSALATVYRGSDGRADFAVKIYERAFIDSVRADLEPAAQGKIQHPSVARLVGSGRLADGAPYVTVATGSRAPAPELVADLESHTDELLLAGDGVSAYRDEFASLDHAERAGVGYDAPSVGALVELATAHAEREEFQPQSEIRPLYLRTSDAEIHWDRAELSGS